MKEIIILFGEMGGGKNYHGERLAKEKGYLFLDGDTVADQEMVERVSQFKPLTREIVAAFVARLVTTISILASTFSGMVVAQALYFDEDRLWIEWFFTQLGYDVKFVWIRPSFFRNMKQIYSRPRGFRWVLYWLMNKPWFQKPTHEYKEM